MLCTGGSSSSPTWMSWSSNWVALPPLPYPEDRWSGLPESELKKKPFCFLIGSPSTTSRVCHVGTKRSLNRLRVWGKHLLQVSFQRKDTCGRTIKDSFLGRLRSLWTWWWLKQEGQASFSMVSQTGFMKKRCFNLEIWHWDKFEIRCCLTREPFGSPQTETRLLGPSSTTLM